MKRIKDNRGFYEYRIINDSKSADDPGKSAPVYLEILDLNCGEVVVEGKMSKAKAREIGQALLDAGDG